MLNLPTLSIFFLCRPLSITQGREIEMKCSKCGYVSFDSFDNCKMCGYDLTEIKAKLNIPSYFLKTDIQFESQEDHEIVNSIDSSTEFTEEASEKATSIEEGLIIDSEQDPFGEQEDTFEIELEGEDSAPELTIEEPDETTDKEETDKQIKNGGSDAGFGDDISLELEDEEAMGEIFPLDETEKDVEGISSKSMGIEGSDEAFSLEESPADEFMLEPEQSPSEAQEDTLEFELEEEDASLEFTTEETAKAIASDGSDDSLADDLSSLLEDDETLETELPDEDIQLSTSEIESLKEEITLLEQDDEDADSMESSDIEILEFEEEGPESGKKK